MTAPPRPERLSALRGRAVVGTFYRAVLEPFAADPLSIEGSMRHGGRYNPMGAFGALYCGQSPAVCAAEIGKRAAGQPVGAYRLGRIRVNLRRVLDLTDPATVAALGFRTEELVAADWNLTQRIGALAHAAGFEGLLVPSAAGSGHNLVVFPGRLLARSRLRPLGTPRPFRVTPAP